jgi:hypothetical protein
MGRDVTADTTPLLKNAEQNIGNSAILTPQSGTSGTATVQTNPPRIINLTGGSAVGQTTSVILTVSRITPSSSNPNPGVPGPITGVIEFGSGGRSTKVEVDVPFGPYIGNPLSAAPASAPLDGGTIITVPTSVLRAYLRYDNLLLQPVLGNNAAQSLAEILGIPANGPGGIYGSSVPGQLLAEPVMGQAMAAYFTRPHAKVYKTLYCYVGTLAPAIPVSSTPVGLTPVRYCLPAFAKNVKVLRHPIAANLTVELADGANFVDTIAITGGVTSPTIPVIGNESLISIVSNGVLDVVKFLAITCEIGI